MNETVVVITGADAIAPAVVQRIPDGAVLIAADGALDHALAAGLVPAGLVGDMDSISDAGLAWAGRHATIERHDPDKDQTDTELALMMAAELGPARFILVGAGDRLDHVLATIGALGQAHLTSIPVIDRVVGRAVDSRPARPRRHDARARRGHHALAAGAPGSVQRRHDHRRAMAARTRRPRAPCRPRREQRCRRRTCGRPRLEPGC